MHYEGRRPAVPGSNQWQTHDRRARARTGIAPRVGLGARRRQQERRSRKDLGGSGSTTRAEEPQETGRAPEWYSARRDLGIPERAAPARAASPSLPLPLLCSAPSLGVSRRRLEVKQVAHANLRVPALHVHSAVANRG